MKKNILVLLLTILCQIASAQTAKINLSILPESFAICRFDNTTKVPLWVFKSSFYSINKTADELSIVCDQTFVPADVKKVENWRAFKIEGPLDFSLTGIIASLSKPLADNKIPIFVVSTYDTDYILVQSLYFNKAKDVLRAETILKE
ncbi:ACT domain-containing protein [Daejeonella sp.]|jgi:hypothetical protein|uniref:ACT domain-containing protein n=1 Tax=Daejeonella sp. TaxID=2805397 RepID=UPI0037833B8E